MRRVIGLDFGSSQSLVSVMEIGSTQTPEILKFDAGNNVSRTLLALDNNDDHLVAVGNDVWEMLKERGTQDFYVVRNFKRYLGETMPSEEGENVEGKLAEKFCEYYLSRLCEKLRSEFNVERLDKDNFTTCIAHPTTWDENKVQLLVKIVEKAGFPEVNAIPEPLAAIYAAKKQYKEHFADKTEYYLVVDFGGGTLDICIIEMGILGRFAKIVSRSGNPKLGGWEFDKIIETQYISKANLETTKLSSRHKTYIKEECEDAKISISGYLAEGNTTKFICNFKTPSKSTLHITRDEIVSLVREAGILEQYQQCISDALNKSGLDINQISKIVLTGGTSQWRFLQDIFTSKKSGYGIDKSKVILTSDPHTDVCIGCAVYSGYADNRDLVPGIWIKYRKDNEDWSELQQLKAPAEPGTQADCENKYLMCIDESRLLSPYRIEFKWFSGISESSLTEINDETGVVELYARSNKNAFSRFVDKTLRKIMEKRGWKIEEKEPDTYVLYIQMKETAAAPHYTLRILDAKASAKDSASTSPDNTSETMPDGKIQEFEVMPGYISRCNWLGLCNPSLKKIRNKK